MNTKTNRFFGTNRHLGSKGWYMSLYEVADTTLYCQGDEMVIAILCFWLSL